MMGEALIFIFSNFWPFVGFCIVLNILTQPIIAVAKAWGKRK